MRISDWSSDVCSSDLTGIALTSVDSMLISPREVGRNGYATMWKPWNASGLVRPDSGSSENGAIRNCRSGRARSGRDFNHVPTSYVAAAIGPEREKKYCPTERSSRSEEHTSELQSL